MVFAFVDNKGWKYVAQRANTLDYCNPLTIARLYSLWLMPSFRAYNDFLLGYYTHLEARFVKVIQVSVLDTVLSFYIMFKVELGLYNY